MGKVIINRGKPGLGKSKKVSIGYKLLPYARPKRKGV